LRRLAAAADRIRRLEAENQQLREALALALGDRRAGNVLGSTPDTPRKKSQAIIGPADDRVIDTVLSAFPQVK
jgi:hypothetical protein